jgi:hypothetical protein
MRNPALPLLKPGAQLATDAKRLLRSGWAMDGPNGRLWIRRVLGLMFLIAAMVGLSFYGKKRPRRGNT